MTTIKDIAYWEINGVRCTSENEAKKILEELYVYGNDENKDSGNIYTNTLNNSANGRFYPFQ